MPVVDIKQDKLLINESTDTFSYDFGMVQQIMSPEEISKNRITANIEKTFLKKDEQGFMYKIEVTNWSQSNTDGMFGLEKALAFLQKKIILYTDIHGEIISIVNKGQISEDWYDQAKFIKKEFKYLIPKMDEFLTGIKTLLNNNDSFVNLIKESEIYSLLFPTIYNHDLMEKITVHQKKDFNNFFDRTTLPFFIDTFITGINANTKGKQLMRSGKLDTSRFDKESASEIFMQSYGVHEYALNFNASYLETYDMDKENQVDKANGMLGVRVNELYQLKQMSKLNKKAESKSIINQAFL